MLIVLLGHRSVNHLHCRLHKRDTVKAKRAINTPNLKMLITELHGWPFTVDQLAWYIHEMRVRCTAKKKLAWYIAKVFVLLLVMLEF